MLVDLTEWPTIARLIQFILSYVMNVGEDFECVCVRACALLSVAELQIYYRIALI